MDAAEAKVVCEAFERLQEKAHHLFAGLRDLPQFSKSKWQPYFQKTFSVFTKIWQFQQTHRAVLVDNDVGVGLQRWQVGELASKVGQLYYHYYIRTSESSYLLEAAVFYSAVLERGYFDDFGPDAPATLAVKKLRYLARFAVVLMLLDSLAPGGLSSPTKTKAESSEAPKYGLDAVHDALKAAVAAYGDAYGDAAGDAAEWADVVDEIAAFAAARAVITLSDTGATQSQPIRLLVPRPTEYSSLIADALIVAHPPPGAVKFSELTLDAYRMALSLEAAPLSAATAALTSLANPHKYVLYRPTLPQFLTFAAAALKEAPPAEALVVYLSGSPPAAAPTPSRSAPGAAPAAPSEADADADAVASENGGESAVGAAAPAPVLPFGVGGVGLAVPADADAETWGDAVTPGDLAVLARRPLFCIVDADGAHAFGQLPEVAAPFGTPVVVVMAPQATPPKWPASAGSPLTLFLTDPLAAFATLTGAGPMATETYEMATSILATVHDTVAALLDEAVGANADLAPLGFMANDMFLQRYLTRLGFYIAVCSVHVDLAADLAVHAPAMVPALPPKIVRAESLLELVLQLAAVLSVSLKFNDVHPTK